MDDGVRPGGDAWLPDTSFRALVENLPGAVYRCEVALPWRVSHMSGGVLALSGRPAADFMEGRVHWADIIWQADLPAVAAAVASTIDGRLPYSLEYRIVHADGRFRWVHESGRAVGDEGRRPACLEGFILDITDRKAAEAALLDERERYRTAFRTSPDAVNINQMSDGRYLDINDGFSHLTGWTRGEVIGRTSADLGVWDDLRDRERLVAALLRDGACENLEAMFRRKDGTTVPALMSARVMQYGGTTCILSVTRDISALARAEAERQRLERQLQQAQKLESLGVLAGGIAHDFNNILMAVLGHTELALDALPHTSPARDNIAEIATASRRAADLCRQMLAYSGRATFALERTSVRELIEEMVHLLRASVSKKALFNLHLEANLPEVMADPSQIRQIVMNLIINASEAIGDRSGVIALSAGATRCDAEYLRATELADDLTPGTFVHLEVADTGCGMAPDTRARIFEPFFTTKFAGRGLGLAAVLGIVRAHHGAIKVYSEEGKGTTFKVLLPALEPGAVEAAEGGRAGAGGTAAWRGRGTVLFADDEESLRALGAAMLERLGFTVITAADGREALELYRRRGGEIDLVVLDLTMPHLDGAQTFGELRRLNPDVRVVLASGYNREDVAARFAGKSLAGVLQKPYTLSRLRESLAAALDS